MVVAAEVRRILGVKILSYGTYQRANPSPPFPCRETLKLIQGNRQPEALVFSPDGQLLASQFWNAVQLWDVSEWIPQARLTPDPAEIEFSADDPAWKTFTVHTNLDSVLVRANPAWLRPGHRDRRRPTGAHQRLLSSRRQR